MFNLEAETEEQALESIKTLLYEKEEKAKELEIQLEALTVQFAELKAQVEAYAKEIEQLKLENQTLKKYETEVEGFKSELKERIIKYGIKTQGNVFPVESFSKFLETLTIDELKKISKDFEEQFKAKFNGVRVTEGDFKKEIDYVPDPEVEPELFNEFIAEKAKEYAKATGLSIKEATIEMYKKYMNKE